MSGRSPRGGNGAGAEPSGGTAMVRVTTVEGGGVERRSDALAAEEPLEIRVVVEEEGRRVRHSVAVTMRTPGHDFELAAGFLFSEGLIDDPRNLWRMSYCRAESEPEADNIVEVFFAPETPFDPSRLSRHVYTSSSCGICGKASIDQVRLAIPAPPIGGLRLTADLLHGLPRKLAGAQDLFARTGGLHASALFDAEGRLLLVREDVGRHNALDKLIGVLLQADELPASERVLLVSGRASFELVQKALMAGIPVLASVGAPSSLAVEAAEELGMTLVGFLRRDRFNVYAGGDRIALS